MVTMGEAQVTTPRVFNMKYVSRYDPILLETRVSLGENDVYVGRPSKWGNPFIIGKDGTRDEVLEKYRLSLTDDIKRTAKEELKGKNLICWCAPEACHADILLEIANA